MFAAGIAGKSTNLYTYAVNCPVLYQDPSGEIVPAVLGAAAVIGAVTNSAIYAVTSSSTGDFSWGGLAGAAVSGAVTGAGIATGASLAGEYSATLLANLVLNTYFAPVGRVFYMEKHVLC